MNILIQAPTTHLKQFHAAKYGTPRGRMLGQAMYLFTYYHWADGRVEAKDLAYEFGRNQDWFTHMIAGKSTNTPKGTAATLELISKGKPHLTILYTDLIRTLEIKGIKFLEKVYRGLHNAIMELEAAELLSRYGDIAPRHNLNCYRGKYRGTRDRIPKPAFAIQIIALIAQNRSRENNYNHNTILLRTLDELARKATEK